MIDTKFDMHVKNIKNMQFNYKTFEKLIQQKIIKKFVYLKLFIKDEFLD